MDQHQPRRDTQSGAGLLAVSAAVLGVLLVVLQFGAMERLKTALLERTRPGEGTHDALGLALGALNALAPIDWIALALIGAILIVCAVLELRTSRLSRDLARALESRRGTWLLLGAFGFAATRFYFAPGELTFGDSPVHVSRIYETALSFARGSRPDWSFRAYAGYPLLQFYSPLFYWLGGATQSMLGDPNTAAKSWLFLFHLGSGFALYAWARAIGLSRHAGFFAALGYVMSFQHTHLIIWAGALPVAPLFVFVPLLLTAIERLLRGGGGRWIWLLAAATAGSLLSHHGHAAFVLQLAAIYGIARWTFAPTPRPSIGRLVLIAVGVAGGLLLGSELIWSVRREGIWTHHPEGMPWLHPQLSLGYLKRMVVWRDQWSGFTGAYVGATFLTLALVGAVTVCRRSSADPARNALRAVLAVTLVALACAEQAGGRVGDWMLPPLALLAGSGAATLISRPGRLLPRRVALGLLILLVVDLGSTTIQSCFRRDRQELTRELEAMSGRVAPHRALYALRNPSEETRFYDFWDLAGDVPMSVLGGFPQGAPRSLDSQLAMVDQLNESPEDLDESDLDLLYLWDVSTVLVIRRSELVPPKMHGTRAGSVLVGAGRVVPYAEVDASPILFASALRTVPPSDFTRLQEEELQRTPDELPKREAYRTELLRWTREMAIDRTAGRAEVILLHPDAGGLDSTPAPAPPDSTPAISLGDCRVEQRKATIEYQASAAGFLRLAFSWYPTLQVHLDGRPVAAARELFGAIVIATPPGRHVIELVPTRTRARRAVSWAGPLLGLFVLGVASVAAGRPALTGRARTSA